MPPSNRITRIPTECSGTGLLSLIWRVAMHPPMELSRTAYDCNSEEVTISYAAVLEI